MSGLRLEFLGSPQVAIADTVLAFPTSKALALLAFLVVEPGLHRREKITGLLWSESDSRRGRASMRRTLSYLRKTLGSGSYLIVETDQLGFETDSDYELDLDEARRAWVRARSISFPQQPAENRTGTEGTQALIQTLQGAISLYRGGFLAGFSLKDAPEFDNWTSLHREIWHQRIDLVFDRLSQLQQEGADLPGALETTRRWLSHSSLNEVACRRLMELHFRMGNRKEAFSAFEEFRSLLRTELDIDPAPETIALVERIRRGSPARRPVGLTALTRRSPHPLDEAPFVGRVDEHSLLVEMYQRVQTGKSLSAVIEGESGIGKTRLAREFLAWAASKGADLLQGRAYENAGNLPYQPVIQALRTRLDQENAPEDLLPDIWLSELSRLVPELRDRYPDLPVPMSVGELAQANMFEAVAQLTLALQARAPLIFFIDDLHWIDLASMDLLQYCHLRWVETHARALTLFTLRPEDLDSSGPRATRFNSFLQDFKVRRIQLSLLSASDLLNLIHQLGGRRPAIAPQPESAASEDMAARELSDWLYEQTSGQPLYIVETLRYFVEQGFLRLRQGTRGGRLVDLEASPLKRLQKFDPALIPPSVVQVIRARLERLSAEARDACLAGAVLGNGFDFDSLRRVAQLDEPLALRALDELLNQGLCREDRESGPRQEPVPESKLFFTHDTILNVVYSLASEARRRVYHQRALTVLSEANAPAAVLVWHALAGGLPTEAFTLALRAGDDAMRLFAARVAITHYDQARFLLVNELSEETAAISQAQHLYRELGRAYELAEEFSSAQAIYQEMLNLGQQQADSKMECIALNSLATVLAQGSRDLDSALTLLTTARKIAEKTRDPRLLTETEWNLAQVNFYRFDAPTSLTHGRRALALARRNDLPEFIARSLNVIAYAETVPGNWPAVEEFASQAYNVFKALGNRALEADSLSLLGKARINLGKTQAGIEAALEALKISREIKNTWGQANCAKHLAFGYLERGQPGQALALALEGESIARQAWYPLLLVFNLTIKGAILRNLQDFSAARAAHQEALALNETLPSRPFEKTLAAELAVDCALSGRWEEAYQYERRALAAQDITMIHSGLYRWLEIEALLNAGEIELAKAELDRFAARLGAIPRYQIPLYRSKAALANRQGQITEAALAMKKALNRADELQLPVERWQILAELAKLYGEMGAADRARSALKQAAEIVREQARNVEDSDLRAGFLSSEHVRQVLQSV